MSQAVILVNQHIEGVLLAWLHEHAKNSARTAGAYGDMARDFQRHVQEQGFDIDAPAKIIAYHAQAWAALPNSKTGLPVSASTHNLRLAAISSFYEYAIRHDELAAPNPIDRVKRMKRQMYTGAHALPYEDGELDTLITAIPDDTLIGLRDRALLSLALYTGRRLAEIAALLCGDITIESRQVHIMWRRTKGGKQQKNELPPNCPASAHLTRWLKRFYGIPWPKEGIVFPSLARNNYGGRMSAQAMEQIAAKRIGTSKFHALRHTFAALMLAAGASPTEIQEAMGHSSLAVTSAYLPALSAGKNTHLATMADILKGKGRLRKVKGA